jgi:hypothetical protein
MNSKPKETGKKKSDNLKWLLVQTIVVFIGLSTFVYLFTGDYKGAVVMAVATGIFLVIVYVMTGKLLIKITDA